MKNETESKIVIAEKPAPFCLVHVDWPPEVVRPILRKWLRNVLRFVGFWDSWSPADRGPAILRYWCGRCSETSLHDVNQDGPVAHCPDCGNRVDLRPEGEFGGMDSHQPRESTRP